MISGTVVDLHGAVIPGAKIGLIDRVGSKRLTITNTEGDFRFANLPSGDYRLEISSALFKMFVVEDLLISGDMHFEKAFVLEVENGIEIVGELVVSGEPIVCEDSPKISDQIEMPKLMDLPLPARTFTMGLFPGVAEKLKDEKPAKRSKKKLPK